MYSTPKTNQAGTAIALISEKFGDGASSLSNRTIAYPTTTYFDYDSTYVLCGTLPTVTSGSATCLTYQNCADTENNFPPVSNGGARGLPSHPHLPEGIQPDLDTIRDPKGLTYHPMVFDECDYSDIIKSLFPNLGLWSCEALNYCGRPPNHKDIVLSRALYLTATSTSVEVGEIDPSSRSVIPRPLNSPTVSIATQTKSSVPIPASPTSALSNLDTVLPLVPSRSTGNVTGSSPLQIAPFLATTSALDEASAGSEVLPPTLTTSNPVAEIATAAQRIFATVFNLPAAVPVPVTSLDANGNNVVSTSLSTKLAVASQAPATLVPLAVSSTDVRGNLAVSKSFVAAIAIPTFSTHAQAQTAVTTSLITATGGASISNIIFPTYAQAPIVSRTSYLPVIILTTTNARGPHIVTTSPLLTATVHDAADTPVTTAPAISGTEISLTSDGANALGGTSTEWLGGSNRSSTSTGPQAYTGDAQSKHSALWVEAVLVFIGLGIVMRL